MLGLPIPEKILTPKISIFRSHAVSNQLSAVSQSKFIAINYLNRDRPTLLRLKVPSDYN